MGEGVGEDVITGVGTEKGKGEDLLKALQYILDRLNYVYYRIDLIYE